MNETRNGTSKNGTKIALATALLAGLGALGGAGGAFAEPAQAPQVVVRYGDLDLGSASGMRTLHRRLEAAAREVCPAASPQELDRFDFAQGCRAQALARAMHEIEGRQLARLARPAEDAG